jgi:hypothetical protein
MQAFFAESTFPMGEGFGLAQQLDKSEVTGLNSYIGYIKGSPEKGGPFV